MKSKFQITIKGVEFFGTAGEGEPEGRGQVEELSVSVETELSEEELTAYAQTVMSLIAQAEKGGNTVH